jgi:hypothetical protein
VEDILKCGIGASQIYLGPTISPKEIHPSGDIPPSTATVPSICHFTRCQNARSTQRPSPLRPVYTVQVFLDTRTAVSEDARPQQFDHSTVDLPDLRKKRVERVPRALDNNFISVKYRWSFGLDFSASANDVRMYVIAARGSKFEGVLLVTHLEVCHTHPSKQLAIDKKADSKRKTEEGVIRHDHSSTAGDDQFKIAVKCCDELWNRVRRKSNAEAKRSSCEVPRPSNIVVDS